jgi:ribosomal protein S14
MSSCNRCGEYKYLNCKYGLCRECEEEMNEAFDKDD